jgi:flagellar export protein FliJ
MAFHFPLEAVLRYRRSIERQQEMRLQQANQKLAATEQRLMELFHTLAKMAGAQIEQLQSGTTAAEMHFSLLCRAAILRQRSELETQKVREQTLCRECVHALRQARQLREAAENLRHQQLAIYQQEGRRREQGQLDDLFLLRRDAASDGPDLPGS